MQALSRSLVSLLCPNCFCYRSVSLSLSSPLLTLGAHAHESYSSQFVCLSIFTLVSVYDVCGTN